jgi:hypothetical protein
VKKCRNCGFEWKDGTGASRFTECPACKKSLVENEDKTKFCETRAEALAAIMEQFGVEVLLGRRLNAYLKDIAPRLSNADRDLIYAVRDKGASQVLKEHHNNSQADKERAVMIAVDKLTEAWIAPVGAELIIREFATVLGWNCVIETQRITPTAQPVTFTPPPEPSLYSYGRDKIIQDPPLKQTDRKVDSYHEPIVKIGSTITFGKYNWRVLDSQNNKALIITENIIAQRRFDLSSNNWENSELKKQYLDSEFYNEFSYECKKQINGGIFLLSAEEARKYFKYDSDRVAKFKDKTCWWWLRTPAYRNDAISISESGSVHNKGLVVYSILVGVRPALWLDLNA